MNFDLVPPEQPARLFRALTKLQMPPGDWNAYFAMVVPIRDDDRLLGFARVDPIRDQDGLMTLHLVIDYESIYRLDIEVGKKVYAWPVWMIDETIGPQTMSLLQLFLSSTPAFAGQQHLTGEFL